MKIKKYLSGWMRSPRTTQEKRANGRRNKWVRGKRSANNLVDAWDDIWVHHDKCWKSTRKTQYRNRGKCHEIFLSQEIATEIFRSRYSCIEWILENYFKDHDIPHRIEEVKISEQYYNCYFQKYMYHVTTIGYNITWWSDKDIGLEYII